MRAKLLILGLLGVVSGIVPAAAQVTTVVPIGTVVANPALHRLVFGSQIYFVQAPPPGWNLQRVLPGSTVRLELDTTFNGATNVTWSTPLGKISTGTQNWLEISSFQSGRDGTYSATLTLNGKTEYTQDFEIRTTPFDVAPIKNISSRTRISPENPQLIAGFVVGRDGTASGMKRLVVVRAVGPSLAEFGVTSPLADPQVQVFDADGNVVAPVPRWNAQTTEVRFDWKTYEDYLRSVLVTLGAFPVPLPDPATDGPPAEPVREYELAAGSYTAVASSAGNTTGDVLLEVYEFKGIDPAAHFGWPTVVVPTGSEPAGP